jgi:serine/threonine protein kinase
VSVEGNDVNFRNDVTKSLGANLRLVTTDPTGFRVRWDSPVSPLPSSVSPTLTELLNRRSKIESGVISPPIMVDQRENPEWVIHPAPAGQSVRTIRSSNGALTIEIAQTLLARVIDVLSVLHRHELPHGNINPDTIFVNDAGIELIPSYECMDRQLPNANNRPRNIWTSEEMERSEQPTQAEDVFALALVFVTMTAHIDDSLIKSRSEASQFARLSLQGLSLAESAKVILHRALSQNVDERPGISELRLAITQNVALHSQGFKAKHRTKLINSKKEFLRKSLGKRRSGRSSKVRRLVKLVIALVVIVALISGLILIRNEQATSNNLRQEIASLASDLGTAEINLNEVDSKLRIAESKIGELESELLSAQSAIDLLTTAQSTYYDYEGNWTIELTNPGLCTGWNDNSSACDQTPTSFSISDGAVNFGFNEVVSTTLWGGETSGGFSASEMVDSYSYCGSSDTSASIALQLSAVMVTPTTSGLKVSEASGTLKVDVPPQAGCVRASIFLEFTAHR